MKYYSVLKGNEVSIDENTWRKPKFIFRRERSQSEEPTYCVIPTENYGDSEKISGFQEFRGWVSRNEYVENGGFLGPKTTLYDTIMVGMSYICPNSWIVQKQE